MAFDYDLVVIGGGSGGVRAARKAALTGARVALCEESRLGGTCVMRGCVPKKLMVFASEFREIFEDARAFGWSEQSPTHDFAALMDKIAAELDRLEDAYAMNLRKSGADLFSARAMLEDAHTVRLSDDRRLTTDKVLIATGGRPNPHAALPGHELAMVSDDVFKLRALPKRLIVAGGGYIGTEFSAVFAGLGSKVTMVNRGPELLSGFDQELRDRVHRAYVRRDVETRFGTVFQKLERSDGGIAATLSTGEVIEADEVLLALGRKPNTAGLGLDKAGVTLGKKGEVVVDETYKSSADNIFALGDVTGGVELTPWAIREAEVFVSQQFGDGTKRYAFEVLPTAVFSQPPCGTVGPTTQQAVEAFDAVDVYRSEFRPMKNAMAARDERVMFKLLVDASTDKLIAAHLFGADAPELVQVIAVAMNAGVTKAMFDETIALHPSVSEELVTMGDPVERYRGGEKQAD